MTTKKAAPKKKVAKRKPAKITATLIAKDVIKMLADKKLVAEAGVYSKTANQVSERAYRKLDYNGQLQPLFKQPKFKCRVCALGGLFVAAVRRNNDATTQDFDSRDSMHDKLEPWFTYDQLIQIEDAFEGRHELAGSDEYAFAEQYPSDRARMKAIMENVIQHKGKFVLPEAK